MKKKVHETNDLEFYSVDKTIHVKRAMVLTQDHGSDRVVLNTNLPSPFPPEIDSSPLSLNFYVKKGDGVQYVRDNFGIEPEERHVGA